MESICYWLILMLCGPALCQTPVTNETDAMLFQPDSNSKAPHYYRILHVETKYNFMLVGGRDQYFNVSLLNMEVIKSYQWYPSDGDLTFCNGEEIRYGMDCDSYVVSALKNSDSSYTICASSAKKPICRNLRMNAQGEWPLATEVISNLPHPMVPIFPWHSVHKLEADNGALYVVGDYYRSGSIWCPQVYRDNIYNANGQITVPGLRSQCSQSMFNIDYSAERPPSYSNIFEAEDYVYFTLSEPALETFNSIGSVHSVYSRVYRVCKNDKGRGENFPGDDDAQFKFATLFKARMLCGKVGVSKPPSDHYLKQEYKGYYTHYVDEIADASGAHYSSITDAKGEKIILAIFNSAINAVKTAAICAYKVSDINKVFDEATKQVEFSDDLTPSVYKSVRPPAQCYGENENLTASNRAAVNKYLLVDTVKPLNNNALFMSDVDYRMTHMQVDWQVEAIDGKKYDVIFVSTDDGRLLKFVSFAKAGKDSEYHMVEERDIFPGEEIYEMKLIKDKWSKKHLLVNTLDQIKRIAIEKCHFYEDCSSCIGLRDPYCSWSPALNKCVSTTHEASDKYQNITFGMSPQCVGTVSDTNTTVEPEGTPPFAMPESGSSKHEVPAVNTTPYIACIVILPIAVGVAMFFVGFLYSKRRFMSPTPHLDQELTNKCKDDTLKCEAYQTLPKQSNLQLMNNLNGKSPNVETTSMGERTLTRQKQVYV